MKLVQIGAGNIGRSFIGQLFSRAGWEVVFIDLDSVLVEGLNRAGAYRVVIKHGDRADEVRTVAPVRAVDGRDAARVTAEIASADLIATSVGRSALPAVMRSLLSGLGQRERDIDIILAENARDAVTLCRAVLDGAAICSVGLVESSIGKMVPLMRAEDLRADPLQVFAEGYETLILDRHGFTGPLPDVAGIKLVDNIQAYVDRKLFVHNLGHAAAAYLGFRSQPDTPMLAEVLADRTVLAGSRQAMQEASAALRQRYSDCFSAADLDAHIEDLLQRFGNRALGDTVHRVGRDLPRKLSREDRVVGALRLCAEEGLPCDGIAAVYHAALAFAAPDENGVMFPADAAFHETYDGQDTVSIARHVSGLDPADPTDARVLDVLGAFEGTQRTQREDSREHRV